LRVCLGRRARSSRRSQSGRKRPTGSSGRIACCGKCSGLERLKKYGPKSEKLSEEQVELLELEPGVHVQEVEKESGVSSGRKKLLKREHAGRNALPDHLPRREESSKARSGSAFAAERNAAVSATKKRKSSTWNRRATSCE